MKLILPIQVLTLICISAKWIQARVALRHLPSVVENDRCVGALPIVLGTNVSVNLTDATSDEVDVLDDCIHSAPPRYPGLWYSFIGTGGRLGALFSGEICRSGWSTYDNHFISVYKGSCDTLNVTNTNSTNNQCIFARSGLCSPQFRHFFNTEEGTTYHVLIQSGAAAVQVYFSLFEVPTVSNERCNNASSISIGSMVYANFTFTDSNIDFSNSCYPNTIDPGLWYTFVGTGERLVGRLGELCDRVPYYDIISTDISIFKGSCDTMLPEDLQCVASSFTRTEILCDSELFQFDTERFMFDTERDTPYYVLIQSRVYENIVDFSISATTPVENDHCSDASWISIGSTVNADLTYASLDVSEVYTDCICKEGPFGLCFSGSPSFRGLWYALEGTGERLKASLGTNSHYYPSMEVAYITVFHGDCGRDNLRCVDGSGFITDGPESLVFDTIAGRTYYLLLQSRVDTFYFTISATSERCGLFGLGIFCPLTWYGLLGRLLRTIFNF